MNQESFLLVLLVFLVAGSFTLSSRVQSHLIALRALNTKMDALLKAQGIEWPSLSPEVQSLAVDPNRKIAAMKRYRDENPGISLAEAKADVEAFAASRKATSDRRF